MILKNWDFLRKRPVMTGIAFSFLPDTTKYFSNNFNYGYV